MNIQRFVLPATIAAAFHAVLLMQGKVPVIIPNLGVTVNTPEPKRPTDDQLIEIPLPTEPSTEPEQKVSTLAQGVDLPRIDEILTDKPMSDFRVEIETQNPTKVKLDTKIIGPAGSPVGIPGGERINGSSFKPVKFLDKIPQATVRMSPTYPSALRNDGIEGVVMVEFDVDVKGRVVSARVRESSHRAFEEPTLRAVLQWRFEPGLSQGRPVPFRMVIPVNFTLGAG